MELFEALISLLLVGLAVYSRAKKKEQKKTAQVNRREEDKTPSRQPVAVQTAFEAVPAQPFMPLSAPERHKESLPFAAAPIPSSITFPEGVDPCHDGMYEDEMGGETAVNGENAGSSPAAQELIRGIVVGEILNHPRFKNYIRK
ncbi:MAG: hypothetical protein IIX10_05700 [Clostridia bacterium]|nr:hypothetical protein [Clostridia bacterium]